MTTVVVGGIIQRDDKYLLIQEAKAECRGRWWTPTGHVESGESLLAGVIREIKEECGFDVKPTGIVLIAEQNERDYLGIYFATEIMTDKLSYNSEEILDAKWFSHEEILAMQEQIRIPKILLAAIDNLRAGKVVPMSLIRTFPWYEEGSVK